MVKVTTTEEFGEKLMEAVHANVMKSVYPIMFLQLKDAKVGGFGERVDGMAADLERKLDETLKKYLGIRIADLPEEQRRDIRGNFKEVFEKAYKELEEKIKSPEVEPLLKPHNDARSKIGLEEIKTVEDLARTHLNASAAEYSRAFRASDSDYRSDAGLFNNPFLEVCTRLMGEGEDLSIRKELFNKGEIEVPEYRKKMHEIVLESLTRFFSAIANFFTKGRERQGDEIALVSKVDSHVREALGDISAAEACKKAASAALGAEVAIKGQVHRLDTKMTRELASRAGVKLDRPGVGRGRER